MSKLFNLIADLFESESNKDIGVVTIIEKPTTLIPKVRHTANWPKGLKIQIRAEDDKYLTPEGREAVKDGILEIDKVLSP